MEAETLDGRSLRKSAAMTSDQDIRQEDNNVIEEAMAALEMAEEPAELLLDAANAIYTRDPAALAAQIDRNPVIATKIIESAKVSPAAFAKFFCVLRGFSENEELRGILLTDIMRNIMCEMLAENTDDELVENVLTTLLNLVEEEPGERLVVLLGDGSVIRCCMGLLETLSKFNKPAHIKLLVTSFLRGVCEIEAGEFPFKPCNIEEILSHFFDSVCTNEKEIAHEGIAGFKACCSQKMLRDDVRRYLRAAPGILKLLVERVDKVLLDDEALEQHMDFIICICDVACYESREKLVKMGLLSCLRDITEDHGLTYITQVADILSAVINNNMDEPVTDEQEMDGDYSNTSLVWEFARTVLGMFNEEMTLKEKKAIISLFADVISYSDMEIKQDIYQNCHELVIQMCSLLEVSPKLTLKILFHVIIPLLEFQERFDLDGDLKDLIFQNIPDFDDIQSMFEGKEDDPIYEECLIRLGRFCE